MKATAVYTMSVPENDISLLRSLAKRFGWTAKRQRTQKSTKACHLDQALEDFEKGDVKTFDSVDEMMDFLNA